MSTFTNPRPTLPRTSAVLSRGRKIRRSTGGPRLLLSALAALLLAGSSAAPATAQTLKPTTAIQAAQPSALLSVDAVGKLWSYQAPGNTRLGARTLTGTDWQDAKQIVSADWNNDGTMDLITRKANGSLTLNSGQAGGSYRSDIVIGNGWQNYEIAVTKLKRSDSYPGVLARDTVGGKLFYYPNTFGGSLGTRLTLGTSGWGPMGELQALDFDNDGGIDVLARSGAGAYVLYRGTGLGTFVSEQRRTVGSGWNSMSGISTRSGFAGPGTAGLLARNPKGQLFYYPVAGGRFGSPKLIGNGWNGHTIADGTAPAGTAAPGSVYAKEYTRTVYNYVKNWCPRAQVILNHPSVRTGDVYGMMWWGSDYLAIRTDIPEVITKSIALHECGHMLQARAYGISGKTAAVTRMKAIYGGTGTWGLEENADCISAYLSPRAQPSSIGASSQASFWSASCRGYKGEAAKLILAGKRPS